MTEAQRLIIVILQACEVLGLDPSKYEGANGIEVKPFLDDVIASDQISDDVRHKFIEVYQTLESSVKGSNRVVVE